MSSAADYPGDAAGRAGWHAIAIAGPFRGPARVGGWKRKPEGVRKHESIGNVDRAIEDPASRQRAWGVGANADALAGEPSRLGLRNEGVSDDALEDQGQPTPRLEKRPETALPRREVVGTNPECALKSNINFLTSLARIQGRGEKRIYQGLAGRKGTGPGCVCSSYPA